MSNIRQYDSEVLFSCLNSLGEGLLWDVDSQTLYWVDILEKRIFVSPQGASSYQSRQLDHYVSCLAVCEDNQLLIAHEQGLSIYDPESERLELKSTIESDKTDNRFNDGKCDPSGRFWAGTMRMDATGNAGSLYRFNRNLDAELAIEDVSISNGLAWSPFQKRMYYIDTGDNNIKAYFYDDISGDISFDNVLIQGNADLGLFDGMTIDTENNLWVAVWGGACVLHIDSCTGEIIGRVNLPCQNVTNCTFGGRNLDTLFITTAATDLSDEDKRLQPEAGNVFFCRPGVQGQATARLKR